jgi:hypothetical protein
MIETLQPRIVNITGARRVCRMEDTEEMASSKKLIAAKTLKLKTRIRKNNNLIYTYEGRIKSRYEQISALLSEISHLKAKRELARIEIAEDEEKLAA